MLRLQSDPIDSGVKAGMQTSTPLKMVRLAYRNQLGILHYLQEPKKLFTLVNETDTQTCVRKKLSAVLCCKN